MRRELLKLRSLPAPRWTLLISVSVVVIAAVIAYFAGGEKATDYQDAADAGCGIGSAVAAIVLGVWAAGVEYGQKTVRRLLTADPRRARVLAAKAAMAVLAILAVTVLSYALGIALISIAASSNGAPSPASHAVDSGLGALVTAPIYGLVGFGITLLTRSMAGGMTATLVLTFVVDSALGAIPSVGDYSLGNATTDLSNAVSGQGDFDLARGILASLAWLVLVTGTGALRFTRTDVTG